MSKRKSTKGVIVDNPADLSFLDRMASEVCQEIELAPDEITAQALSRRTGKPTHLCYKFLIRKESKGLVMRVGRIRAQVIFKELVKEKRPNE